MSLTSLQLETFSQGAALNHAAPGGFSDVTTGSLTPKLRGVQCPGVSDSRGFSGDPMGIYTAIFDLTISPGSQTVASNVGGVAEGWFLLTNPQGLTDGTQLHNAPLLALQSQYSANNQGWADCGITTDVTTGKIVGQNFYSPNFAANNFGAPVSGTNAWPLYIWLRVCWFNDGTNEYRQAFYRLPGTSSTAWIALTPANNTTGGGAHFQKVAFNNSYFNQSGQPLRMRLAAAQLYKCTSTADWTAASTVSEPAVPIPPQTYAIDYEKGSDSNNGVDSPWKTHAKLSSESQTMGLIPVANPNAGNGDKVLIVNDAYAEAVGNAEINLDTDGLWYTTTAGTNAEAFKPYTTIGTNSASWTQVTSDGAGHTLGKTWWYPGDAHSTLREGISYCPFVDAGATLAATSRNNTSLTVGQYLDATPGSCWNDNSTGKTYYHPYGDTNPTTDGKTYFLSRVLPGGGGSSNNGFLNVTAAGVRVSGVKLQFGMCDSTQQNNFVIFNQGCGGVCQIDNCQFLYADTHALTFSMPNGGSSGVQTQTGQYATCTLNVLNVNMEQALYESLDDNTALLGCFMGTNSAGSIINCTNLTTTSAWAVQGSAAGSGYLSNAKNTVIHGSGAGCWGAVNFTNCNFGGYIQTKDSVTNLTITGTTAFQIDIGSTTNLNVNACKFSMPPICVFGTTTLIENSIFVLPSTGYSGIAMGQLSGATTIQACTFDCTNLPGSGNGITLLNDYGASLTSFTFQNNVVLTNGTYFAPLIYALPGSINPVMNHNEIQAPNSAFTWLVGYNGGGNETFAQSQSLGYDANSAVEPSIPLSAATNYRRTSSPTVTNDLGLMPDYIQLVPFAHRKTPGAYEYIPAAGVAVGQSLHLTYGNFNAPNSVKQTYGNFD